MPLLTIPGIEALKKRKINIHASWPSRENINNRVEPIATPNFFNHFKISHNDKIFTIGSCFAREIEVALSEHGYFIPALEHINSVMNSDLPGLGQNFNRSFLNQYGVPSIFNQIFQAFKVEDGVLPIESYAYEVSPGKFVDMDMPTSVRPAPIDHVVNRRNALMQSSRLLIDCNIVVITLGLSELWWDNKAKHYRNTFMLPRILEAEPDRFELHVLSYSDIYDYLSRALVLIKSLNPNLKVLLTVSPVPMNYTYTVNDVMVANTYSKSVLRAAVEEAVTSFDNVFYYPSYETIILSQRDLAWENDMIHVNPNLVKKIVGRMIAKYQDDSHSNINLENIKLEFDEVFKLSSKHIQEFLGKNLSAISRDPDMAYLSIEKYLSFSNIESARELYQKSKDILDSDVSIFANARIHLADSNFQLAWDILQTINANSKIISSGIYCRVKSKILLELNMVSELIGICTFWSKIWPNRGEPFLMVAFGYKKNNDFLRAESAFISALEIESSNPQISIPYLEFLIEIGKIETARELIQTVNPSNHYERQLILRISGIIGS